MSKPLPRAIYPSQANMAQPQTAMAVVAWTGGSRPAPFVGIHKLEAALAVSLYKMQRAAFNAFWGKDPGVDERQIFWTRARFDAHATFRAGCAKEAIPAEYVNTEPPIVSEPADGY